MKEPVTAKCGHSFEKQKILDWINKDGTCPLCRKPITKEDIKVNNELKRKIK